MQERWRWPYPVDLASKKPVLSWEMSIYRAQGRSLSRELEAPSSHVSGWYVLLPGSIGSLFISNFFTLGTKGNSFTVLDEQALSKKRDLIG